MMRRQSGFSLLEVMVAVALVVMLSAVAVYALRSKMQHGMFLRALGEAQRIADDMDARLRLAVVRVHTGAGPHGEDVQVYRGDTMSVSSVDAFNAAFGTRHPVSSPFGGPYRLVQGRNASFVGFEVPFETLGAWEGVPHTAVPLGGGRTYIWVRGSRWAYAKGVRTPDVSYPVRAEARFWYLESTTRGGG